MKLYGGDAKVKQPRKKREGGDEIMINCRNCGAEMPPGANACPSCGASVEMAPEVSPGDYTAADVQDGKVMGILAYLGILVLIPIFAEKKNPFVRYHTNQGLVLFVAEVIFAIAYNIVIWIILMVSWRLYFLSGIIGLLSIVFLVLAILGIVNVVNGKAKELPVIGSIKLLK